LVLASGCIQEPRSGALNNIEIAGKVVSETLIVDFRSFSEFPENFKVSPDSSRFAYIEKKEEKQYIVINGEKENQYDEIGEFFFSSDSKHLAYQAKESVKWFAVVDGKEGKRYDTILMNTLRFSPDSNNSVYVAKNNGNLFVVFNEIDEKLYDDILKYTPIFSPDENTPV
jgi:hypothetical protein